MQTEKSQPEGKRIMPETNQDFSVCIRDRCLIIFLACDIENNYMYLSFVISFIFDIYVA